MKRILRASWIALVVTALVAIAATLWAEDTQNAGTPDAVSTSVPSTPLATAWTSASGRGARLRSRVAAQLFGNARVVVGCVVGKRPADQAFSGTYSPEPYAPAMLELRWTLSGRVPRVTQLSYRASLNVASSSESPYVPGPGSVDTTVAPLGPVDQVRAAVGLGWDFNP